jgi:hypothetical protein
VEMILLDWTRMGKSYCLAGAVFEKGSVRIVRPLPSKHRQASVKNVGWSPWLLDGHTRWEVFELVGPEPASPEPPHLEDVWVRALRPRRSLAAPEQRRAILTATMPKSGEDLFATSLQTTRVAAFIEPGSGQRSLVTVSIPANKICFAASRREGAPDLDVRVTVPLPGLGERTLPVKDHHLLRRAEAAGSPEALINVLTHTVQTMGDSVAVRLGLSRSFQGGARSTSQCWLMADGFFSLENPQP